MRPVPITFMVSNPPKGAQSPSTLEHPIFKEAIRLARAAVACDKAGRYAEAIHNYTGAAEALVAFVERACQNPKLQQFCCQKVQDYVLRAKALMERPRPDVVTP